MAGETKDRRPGTKPETQGAPAFARNSEASVRSPVAGMDMATFREHLRRAIAGDDTASPAVLARVNQKIKEDADAKKRGMDWWEVYFRLQQAEENLRRIHELIETKRAERDQLGADIRDDERQLATFDRHRQGRGRAEQYRDLNGAFEVNDDGELADQDAEDMLKAWEKRTGRKVDRRNARDTLEAFKEQQKFEDVEALRIKRELEIKRRRLGELDREIEELESAEAKAEAALKNGDDPKKIDADLQRELIAKGNGTDEQKKKLAEEQGVSLPLEQFANANDDEFGPPSIKPSFNQTAGAAQPKEPEIVKENAAQDASPVQRPAMNLSV